LSFGSRSRTSFTREELEFLRTISDQISLALERTRLNSELRQRASELQHANHAKDQFLAALSHELRTPLAPVLMAAAALEENPELPEPVRSDLSMIRRNVELEARLIDDLLDLTRISRGKLALHPEPVDVHAVIRDVLESCCGSDINT